MVANHATPDSAHDLDHESPAGHLPVLFREALDYLKLQEGRWYIDATFGGGGHSRAILEAIGSSGRLLAIDADPEAIDRGQMLGREFPGRFSIRHGNFRDLRTIAAFAGFEQVDGVLMDLGLSSFQLDTPGRGFSFRFSAPLDMRFDPGQALSAADIVNGWSPEQLVSLLFEFGEEPGARRIVRAIVAERSRSPIETTDRLATIVERAVGGRRGRAIHPATRTFQALRIAVNSELEALPTALNAAIELLRPAGRLVVISFHSLEDRIVKNVLRTEAAGCICPPGTPICVCGHQPRLRVLTSRPVRPSPEEEAANPRSRSARLRAAERLA
jgi:16S rRNA (cytosine1402-N4)-methyltransferase